MTYPAPVPGSEHDLEDLARRDGRGRWLRAPRMQGRVGWWRLGRVVWWLVLGVLPRIWWWPPPRPRTRGTRTGHGPQAGV